MHVFIASAAGKGFGGATPAPVNKPNKQQKAKNSSRKQVRKLRMFQKHFQLPSHGRQCRLKF
jgi:hypothetical protein